MVQAITNERDAFLPEGNDLRVLFTNNQVDITDSRAQNDSIYSLNNNSESAKRLRATCHHNTGDTAGTSEGPKSENKNSNAARTSMLNDALNQTISAFEITTDDWLVGTTFDSDNVQINNGAGFNYNLQEGEHNILQVVDENGNMVDATIDQKAQIQDQSFETNPTNTRDMVAIQDYMSGRTNEIPPMLQQMADERGIEDPTRADFDELLRDKFAENHMDIYITSLGDYDEDKTYDEPSTKPSTSTNSIASSASEPLIQASELTSNFGSAATGQTPAQPTVTPVAPAVTQVVPANTVAMNDLNMAGP